MNAIASLAATHVTPFLAKTSNPPLFGNAFHGDQKIKDKYLSKETSSIKAMIHNENFQALKDEIDMPEWLVRLEKYLVEVLPEPLAKTLLFKLLQAIPIGADLKKVRSLYLHYLLTDPKDGVIQYANNEELKQIIETVADLHQRIIDDGTVSEKEWSASSSAAAAHAPFTTLTESLASRASISAAYTAVYAAHTLVPQHAGEYSSSPAARASSNTAEASLRQMNKLLELLESAPLDDNFQKSALSPSAERIVDKNKTKGKGSTKTTFFVQLQNALNPLKLLFLDSQAGKQWNQGLFG